MSEFAGSTVSTHVLDSVAGTPAAGVGVELSHDGVVIATATTDSDGRVGQLAELAAGIYRIRFDTGGYYAATFYPEVVVTFEVAEPRHYHVPLLLAPYGFSTYRGS